jgi:hypothetical protein
MASNSTAKTVITQAKPSKSYPKVSLSQGDLENTIWNQGYDVYIDRAIKCPCRVDREHNAGQTNCQNCGGLGWLFTNRYDTRVILQGMNKDTKFKDWTEDHLGMVKITAMVRERLGYMDRITIQDHEAYHSETMVIKEGVTKNKFARTNYDIKSIEYMALFTGVGNKLQVLVRDTDYTFSENGDTINFIGPYFQNAGKDAMNDGSLSVTIRYTFYPSFLLLDFPRDVIHHHSGKKATVTELIPIHAIGRRAHYVLDKENVAGDYLLDNSYDDDDNKC